MKKATIFTILTFCYFISIVGLFLLYNDLSKFLDPMETTLAYSLLGGLLGGTVYMTRGFYKSIAEGNFDFDKWIYWYLFRPIIASIAGAITFIIIYLTFEIDISIKNQIAIYLASFLAGYNFTDFMKNKIDKIQI